MLAAIHLRMFSFGTRLRLIEIAHRPVVPSGVTGSIGAMRDPQTCNLTSCRTSSSAIAACACPSPSFEHAL